MVVRRLGVWSAAKIAGALYCALGLIVGLIVALVSLFAAGFAAVSQDEGDLPGWFGPALGIGAVVVLPLLYGVIGLLLGAVSAALYNVFARLVGGLEVELE